MTESREDSVRSTASGPCVVAQSGSNLYCLADQFFKYIAVGDLLWAASRPTLAKSARMGQPLREWCKPQIKGGPPANSQVRRPTIQTPASSPHRQTQMHKPEAEVLVREVLTAAQAAAEEVGVSLLVTPGGTRICLTLWAGQIHSRLKL